MQAGKAIDLFTGSVGQLSVVPFVLVLVVVLVLENKRKIEDEDDDENKHEWHD